MLKILIKHRKCKNNHLQNGWKKIAKRITQFEIRPVHRNATLRRTNTAKKKQNFVLQSGSSFFLWKGRKGVSSLRKSFLMGETKFCRIRTTQRRVSMNGPIVRDFAFVRVVIS
jgi:hypothetical protein